MAGISPEILAEAFVGGLALGGIYALIAFTLSLTISTTRVLNVAHGDFLTLGAASSVLLLKYLSFHPLLAFGVVLVFFLLVGIAFEKGLVQPILGKAPQHMLIGSILITFGLALALESSLGFLWSAYVDPLPRFSFPILLPRLDLLGLSVSGSRGIIMVFVALAILAFHLFLTKTLLGKGTRALAQNYEAALIIGLNPHRLVLLIFTAAILATSVSGMFYILAVPLEPYAGLPLTIKALTVVILGGVGSLPGVLIAGLVLGLVETVASLTAGSMWSPVVAVAILFVILIVRPTGLMGRELL
jgi:branched-chain amino acid transport system permease protein